MMSWHPSVSWGQLCPHPTSCPPPPSSLWDDRRSSKGLDSVQAHISDTENTSVICAVFSTNPKHCTMQAAIKKINSIPAKTSTWSLGGNCCSYKVSPVRFPWQLLSQRGFSSVLSKWLESYQSHWLFLVTIVFPFKYNPPSLDAIGQIKTMWDSE